MLHAGTSPIMCMYVCDARNMLAVASKDGAVRLFRLPPQPAFDDDLDGDADDRS